ncbi:Sodium/hydrogen exchanger [Dorcoceras hygrometricum]|uniref:Sodium/hydrogen exchanger n=1 Tax=Dorcoceras hygrometricum TaxID=472368 RepID=A0A2Z7DIK5_9LAMI|nr:Sodium/hydrogen exchanger [Dorcoceras hygrometricum]
MLTNTYTVVDTLPIDFSHHSPNTDLDSSSQSSSTDSRLLFTTADILLGDDKIANQMLMPSTATPATDVTESFTQLRASITQLSIKQLRTNNRVKQEVHIYKTALSFELLESKREVRAQYAIVMTDLGDIRKEVQNQKATFPQDMDGKLNGIQDQHAAISHYLMEFHVQAQENFNTLTSQLSELVDYINRGGDAKKGKEVAAKDHSLPLIIVADLVLVMKDLAEVVEADLLVKDITVVVVLTKDQEEALDTG